jgi:hypothetical protein
VSVTHNDDSRLDGVESQVQVAWRELERATSVDHDAGLADVKARAGRDQPEKPPARGGAARQRNVLLAAVSVVFIVGSVFLVAGLTGPTADGRRAALPGPTAPPTQGRTGTPGSSVEPTYGAGVEGTDAALPTVGSYNVMKEDVRVTLAGGSAVQRSLDLDQPAVNADSNRSDVVLSTAAGPAELRFTGDKVAIVRSANVTPDECAVNVQLSPSDRVIELSRGLVLCTVTNGVGAINEPIRPRMARIVVNSVSPDGTTVLTITNWEIPR